MNTSVRTRRKWLPVRRLWKSARRGIWEWTCDTEKKNWSKEVKSQSLIWKNRSITGYPIFPTRTNHIQHGFAIMLSETSLLLEITTRTKKNLLNVQKEAPVFFRKST